MLSKLGNKNFALMAKTMDLHAARHRVISQNIANVNTPHYRRRTFRFESRMRDALRDGTANSYRGVKGYVARPNLTPIRNNGNNVDIDLEMYQLNENSRSYSSIAQLYRKKSGMVKAAIRGM